MFKTFRKYSYSPKRMFKQLKIMVHEFKKLFIEFKKIQGFKMFTTFRKYSYSPK